MFRTSRVHRQEDHIVHAVLYATSFMHLCKQSGISALKTYHTKLHVQYSLPDDEHMMFETCRRQDALNQNINLKSVNFVG